MLSSKGQIEHRPGTDDLVLVVCAVPGLLPDGRVLQIADAEARVEGFVRGIARSRPGDVKTADQRESAQQHEQTFDGRSALDAS